MASYFTAHAINDFLQAEGLVPANCSCIELLMPPNGAIAVRYERLLAPDDLDAFSRALAALAKTTTPRSDNPVETERMHMTEVKPMTTDDLPKKTSTPAPPTPQAPAPMPNPPKKS